MDAKAGDYVKITTKDNEYQGILMPRPELLAKGITVLKLDNGYNIGIENKQIKNTELLKEYKHKDAKKRKLKNDPKLPNVSIMSTGGTISSKIDYKTGGVYADYTAEDFVMMCPELESIANINARKVMGVMSEDITPKEIQEIAKHVAEEINKDDVDGIVLTMGTDMLHYIVSGLSFFIENTTKPIIVTASQRSIDRGSSDAFMNLICSVNAAANLDYAGIGVCMHGTTNDDYCLVNRGTKVRKMHTSRRDAFRPINELPLAKILLSGKIEILNDNFEKKSDKDGQKVKLDNKYENKVALVQIYPGIDGGIIDYHVSKGVKGIVIAGTALGHIPTNGKGSILKNVKAAIDAGVMVVIATQTIYGRTHPYVYTNLRKLSVQLGCAYAEDMLADTALMKLGWVLAKKLDMDEAKELFMTNCRGEITDKSVSNSFLY